MAAIPAGELLLVSPHRDDAIFSCEALVGREEPLEVLTVFAGEPDPPQRGWWDVECGFADSRESLAARRAEEEAAFAGTAHRRRYLDLLEIQHVNRRTEDERREIAASVAAWVSEHPDGTVAIPVGAGCSQSRGARLQRWLRRETCSPPQHVDHVFVRDAALPALRETGGTPLLYEEVPYLFGAPGDLEAERSAASGGWEPESITIDIDRVHKAERIAAYASQLPHISPAAGRLDEPSVLPATERYWLLRSTSS